MNKISVAGKDYSGMKDTLAASYMLCDYFDRYPNATNDEPEVIRLRKIIDSNPNKVTRQTKLVVDDNEIIKLYERGFSTVKIAHELGYSQSSVSKHLQALGINRKTLDSRLDSEIIQMHKDGLTRTAMASKLGFDFNRINARCKILGLKPNKHQQGQISPARVRKMMKQGLNIQAMAKKLKVGAAKVTETMNTNGMRTQYNEIQKLTRQYVFILEDGGYHQYDNLQELRMSEHLGHAKVAKYKASKRILTRFDWLQKWGVKG